MYSFILSGAAYFLRPFLLLFALIALIKGHHEPGGGFIAGLLASSAFILQHFVSGVSSWASPWVRPHGFIATGLSLALLSGMLSFWTNDPFMTGQWGYFLGIALGSPLLFDLGVCFAVLGSTLLIFSSLTSVQHD